MRAAAIGTLHQDSTSIVIHESVLDQILAYSEQDLQRELGGFLLGSAPDERRACCNILHFLPAVDARSRSGSLTFTHETWAAMNQAISSDYPDAMVLGWHHTHPDFGIFLSAYDLFIHRHFFNQPWQVALVVDPVRCEFGFFQWVKDEVLDCGFYLVSGV